MAKVTFFQPTKSSDLPSSVLPGGSDDMTTTIVSFHSLAAPVTFVSLLGEGFNPKDPLHWQGDIHAAMIDSPDTDWFANILIENPSPQPPNFSYALFVGDLASVVSMLMSGPDKVLGSKHADTVFELGGGDVIHTGAGHDTLDGGAGDDRLIGGRGKDTLLGGAGRDEINGGPGNGQLRLHRSRQGRPDSRLRPRRGQPPSRQRCLVRPRRRRRAQGLGIQARWQGDRRG